MAITISDTEPRVQYTATSAQTTFSVPFEFFTVNDIKVYNGSSLLTYNASPSSASQYSVTGAGVTGGGSIVLGGGATLNDIVTIFRDLAISRSTDFPTSGAFQIDSLNTELDKIIAMSQQLERDLKLSPKASSTTSSTYNLTFPELSANKILTVNSGGTALEFAHSITNVNTIAAIASDVTTVSGIAANVTSVAGNATNINAVAADATDIGAVAAKATEIGRLGTADAVADLAILGTADVVTDLNTLGTADVVADMNTLGTADVVSDMNTLATAAIVTDMDILATTANVTAMGHLGTADNVTKMGLLGNAATITDLGILGTAAIVTDLDLLATTANVSAMGLLGVAGVITDMGILGTADVVTDMNVLATADVVADMNTLGTADVVSDMNTLATGANVTAMATCATNIADVNNFVDQYTIAASAPGSPSEGDLWYDSTNNVLKVHNGSSFVAVTSATAGITDVADDTTPQLGGALDVNGQAIVSVTNGDIAVTPHGTGDVILDGLKYPQADGTANQLLKTDGNAQLSFTSALDGALITTGTVAEARLPASALGAVWESKATGFTAEARKNYYCDTSSAPFTATLPLSATIGDEIHILDVAGTFDSNNLTVGRNSHKIQALSADMIVDVERAGFTLTYYNATQGWLLKDV